MDETSTYPRKRPLIVVAAVVLATMLVPVSGDANEAATMEAASAATETTATACAGGGGLFGHSRPFLAVFTGTGSGSTPGSDFYAGPEGSNVTATVQVTKAERCEDPPTDPTPAETVQMVTVDGSAQSEEDYGSVNEISPPLCDVVGLPVPPHNPCEQPSQPSHSEVLSLSADAEIEPAVESFLFRLQNGSPFPVASNRTTEAPVHIIDTDGTDRVSLEPTLNGGATVAYAQSEQPITIGIPVFWAGPGPVEEVHYTVAPGSPPPTPNVDYRVDSANPLPTTAFTHGGGRVGFIRIRIFNDQEIEPDEEIVITLDDDPAYEVVSERATTTLMILDTGSDDVAPETRFHHPRQGLKYRRADYRIREFHTFYKDEGGSGVAVAHLALRRKMENGKCAWWRGKRFRPGPCGKKVWKPMKHDEDNFLFYYRFKPLRPTVGTKIKSYRAWTRGRDWAGNMETAFKQGRNLSTFWIRRK